MENNSILQKLDGLEARFEEVSTLITDPNVIADQNRFVKLTKEYKDLGDIMDARKRYIACLNSIKETKDILANEDDAEMKEMAREELAENEALQPKLEEEIKIALIPKDPEDAKNVQMEIRAGTGGDEACLFAGDLFKMYKSFCDSKGWQLAVTSVSEGAVGGYKEIDFAVSGADVYGTLKYESGVHRVQRVPATETQGRMHTSAATVAVLPEADKFEVHINEARLNGTLSEAVVLVDRMLTRWSLVFACVICGKIPIRVRRRRYLLNVLRHVTSRRTKNVPSRACTLLYMTRSTKNIWTISLHVERHWYLLVTVRRRFEPITSHKDV